MKLRFVAREDALATVPGSRVGIGQPANYIGRTFVPPDKVAGKGATYPATAEPHEAVFDLTKQDDVIRFNRYVKIASRGDIWPADEDTAKACGVAFIKASFKDGEWTRVQAPAAAPQAFIADKQPEKAKSRKESE